MNNKKPIIIILTSLITLFFGIKEFIDNRKLEKKLNISEQSAISTQIKVDSLNNLISKLDLKNKELINNENDLANKIKAMELNITKQKNTINLYRKNLNYLQLELNKQKKEIVNFDLNYKNTDDELIKKIKKITN